MKIGIDSYCYHRFFGEIYPGLERDPGRRMSLLDFIDRAEFHGVEGVSLESFMLGTDELAELKVRLDKAGFYRVWAWGHPRGLQSGTAPEELADLFRNVDTARAIGADVMRICAGGRRTRTLSWTEHKALLVPLLRQAADYAVTRGVTLAVENHIDFTTDEMLELITDIDHPFLGICLDTANNLRMLEDPMIAIEKMAPYAKAVHLKDVAAFRGSPRDFGFWPSVPTGSGLIDMPQALAALEAARFDGLLALEVDYIHPSYGEEEEVIASSLSRMRELVGDLARRKK